MELTELRTKEEVKEDIEATRRETKRALRDTKVAWVTQNPAVLAWKRTKSSVKHTKYAVTDKVHETDCAVRSNIYKLLGVAALAGALVGVFSKKKRERAQRCC